MAFFLLQFFGAEFIQVAIAILSGLICGLASYFAAQKGVAVALARHDERLAFLKENQETHRKDDNDRFTALDRRLIDLERPRYSNHQ